ncbi:MAG TPA: hypothetical protein VL026_01715, partial [Rhizomicrobium sp.]|nr:hypothetical protein [Rhizomicrobium sp.]
ASGPATAGLFGGAYSVSGACVPRAETLRTACETYGFTALADGETAGGTPRFALLEIDRPAPQGSDEPGALYALLGDAALRASPTFRAVETFHARIFAALKTGNPEEARTLIAQAAQLSGASHKLYALYLARLPQVSPLKAAS